MRPPWKYLYSLDTETTPFGPGNMAPPLVCIQDGIYDPSGQTVEAPQIHLPDYGVVRVYSALIQDEVLIAGHNLPYDFACIAAKWPGLLPLIFRKYQKGLVADTMLREQLLDLAAGQLQTEETGGNRGTSYSLGAVWERYTGEDISHLKGDSSVRTNYSVVKDTPIEQWPGDYVDYAKKDVVMPAHIFFQQTNPTHPLNNPGRMQAVRGVYDIANEIPQTQAMLPLQLMQVKGIRSDVPRVMQRRLQLLTTVQGVRDALVESKLYRVNPKNASGVSKNKKLLEEMVARCFTLAGEEIPLTDGGESGLNKRPSLKSDVLKKAPLEGQTNVTIRNRVGRVTGSPLPDRKMPALRAIASISLAEKYLSSYIEPLLGTGPNKDLPPGQLIHAWWIVLLNSGRISCRGPSLQVLPRGGGIRECLLPAPGCCYVLADYGTVELRTLAQVCLDWFGFSRLADALNAGLDPHCILGADVWSAVTGVKVTLEEFEARRAGHGTITHYEELDQLRPYLPEMPSATTYGAAWYEIAWAWICDHLDDLRKALVKLAKDYRQMAKAGNFGYPGGLGAESFREYARTTYNVTITSEQAVLIKKLFMSRWTEMDHYFRRINANLKASGQTKYNSKYKKVEPIYTLEQPRSGRLRGGTRYTQACNSNFQGLAADGAKQALFWVSQEAYTGYSEIWPQDGRAPSPLFGYVPIIIAHDEIVLEGPCEQPRVSHAAERLKDVMVRGMRVFVPQVVVLAEPVICMRYSKEATSKLQEDGTLSIWVEPPLDLSKIKDDEYDGTDSALGTWEDPDEMEDTFSDSFVDVEGTPG